MADTKLTGLTAITTPASADKLYIVDVSDTTDSSDGSSRQITFSNLTSNLAASGANSDITSLSGLTTPLTVAQGGTGVVTHGSGKILVGAGTSAIVSTLAAPSGAIVGTTDTQILSAKTLTLPQINDTSANHQYIVAVSELAADRTVTFPLLTGNDTFVFGAHAQNLSNKTFTDQTEFSEDINLATGKNIQVNDADPNRTIALPAAAWAPTTTSGCADIATVEAGTNDIDYRVLDFATGSDENAFINFQMPDSWDAGVIQFRYVWTNAGGGAAETVVFELSGRAYADNDAIDQAVSTPAIEVEDTWIAQGDIHISAWSGDVTLAGTAASGEWVHLEIMRDVGEDDLTGDARLIEVQIRYKQKQYSD